MAASLLEIHWEFDYINWEIDDIFNVILCVSIMSAFIFFAISFAEVLKHVKLIILENYSECKTKHLFLKKKSTVVTQFDKK